MGASRTSLHFLRSQVNFLVQYLREHEHIHDFIPVLSPPLSAAPPLRVRARQVDIAYRHIFWGRFALTCQLVSLGGWSSENQTSPHHLRRPTMGNVGGGGGPRGGAGGMRSGGKVGVSGVGF